MYFLAIFSYKTSIEAKSAIVTSDHPDMHKEIRLESENPLFSRFDFLLTPPSSGNRKSPPKIPPPLLL